MATRKTTAQRGYGTEHQRERKKYERRIKSGETFRCSCARPDCTGHDGQCQTIITAGMQWDLGHNADRTDWSGPECIPCNRGDGARNSNRARRDDEMFILDW